MRTPRLIIVVSALAMLSACGASAALPRDTPPPPPEADTGAPAVTAAPGVSAAAVAAATAASQPPPPSDTVWLCRPDQANNPCLHDRGVTAVAANGSTTAQGQSGGTSHNFDCFYVYPTVSQETTDNSDLQVQTTETDVAFHQASQFSSVCDVWAPMYRQITWTGLSHGSPQTVVTALTSVTRAWHDYLANDNHGRPVIFIGHSQGAAMLIMLLRNEVDHSATLRHQMVSAIILGGDLTVAPGSTVGGAFTSIPACTAPGQTGCVIAYSSFLEEPPQNTGFGKPGQGAALLWGETQTSGQQVLCTNPAALGGGSGTLHPLHETREEPPLGASTPWVTFPDLYTASCQSRDGITWLQLQGSTSSDDHRPREKEGAGPTWGLHGDDVNLALGDLVNDVALQERSYH